MMNRIRAWRERAHKIGRRFAGRSRFLSAIYYGLFNRELLREAQAVAAGQTRYWRDCASDLPSYPLLRRNIHRLEKGLIMRPRRPVFGLDYLPRTMEIYRRALGASKGAWSNETIWAHDVLTAYFDAVDRDNPVIARAHRDFVEVTPAPPAPKQIAFTPYRRALHLPPPVDIEAFEALSHRRRSVRWYLDKPIPRELIDRAVEAAAQAPSACNRQPFVFRVFDDKEEARRIAALPMGTKGFSDQLPAVAVLVGQLRCYPYERDRHAIYIDGSLAAMSFMFAMESLGLATCPINWPDQEPHEMRMREALDLEPDERVIMLIAFGWPDPDGEVPYSSKRDLKQLRRYG